MIVSLLQISRSIIEETHIDIINSNRRYRDIADARRIYGLISKQLTGESLLSIGKHINKDHATILHYCKTAKNLIETDTEFSDLYYRCLGRINKIPKEEILENLIKYHEDKIVGLRFKIDKIKNKTA
ncbi:MAG: helix-turn-helix domain-containing protein [Flavobacteriaceae bacterium]